MTDVSALLPSSGCLNCHPVHSSSNTILRTMSYKKMHLAPVSYKDSGLKVLFTFQVWARLFCRSMYFFVFVFSYLQYCMNVSHARLDDIKYFLQAEPEHYYIF